MFEGKTFFGATGMPRRAMALVRTRFEDWLPEPLTVATRIVKSLTARAGIRLRDYSPQAGGLRRQPQERRADARALPRYPTGRLLQRHRSHRAQYKRRVARSGDGSHRETASRPRLPRRAGR